MGHFTHSDSVDIDAPPEVVYDLVSDVTRTGEWSPVCRGCEWKDTGDPGPREGAWFVGHNELAGRTWDTESVVVAARRGKEFAWTVGGSLVAWAYTMEATAGGTRLTESWEFLPEGREFFRERFGEKAEDEMAARREAALDGIPKTLAAIKRIAETGT